ncbi:hypothetical protein OAO18_00725 [Francisellaceae bacterium]|nr:hypothetical protein [Francisellaceae bacterium]
MKKIMITALMSAIAISSSGFAYNLKVDNTSTKDIVVKVFQHTPVTIPANTNSTVTVPSWDYNVSLNYQGKWSPQGFLQIQRSATYDVISSQQQVCAPGRADLKTVLQSGLDKNSYLSSSSRGTCSLDGGDTCKIAPNSNDQADVILSVSGSDCA